MVLVASVIAVVLMNQPLQNLLQWLWWVFPVLFAPLGAGVACHNALRMLVPCRIRHASPEILPDVPRESVIYEGAMTDGRLMQRVD
ncbi:MAG: hypothetical protein JNL67_02775 [Planctomycetaceae bacterium]|nr:hypothetical protein [Planctomycetaceae bacterium]